jgi:RNA recognition motif-containing protein
VSNVPKGLEDRDIREAFEDVGAVKRCTVERGVAIVSFDSPSAAKKAVNTFDRGELNGQTIYVTFEH